MESRRKGRVSLPLHERGICSSTFTHFCACVSVCVLHLLLPLQVCTLHVRAGKTR